MVDHRADEDGDFRIYVTDDEPHQLTWSVLRDRISNWFRQPTPAAERPSWPPEDADAPASERQAIAVDDTQRAKADAAPDAVRARPRSRQSARHDWRPLSEWLTSTRLAIGVTAVWLAALGAYGVGYFLRVQDETGAAAGVALRGLPTVELLFFAFAVCGPVAMVWTVVAMMRRAEKLTEVITMQSESVLALATTISTLHESIEALSDGTAARLEETCARMDRTVSTSTARMSHALSEISGKVDSTILDSVITLDKSNRERLLQVEQTLEAERSAFADRLDGDAKRMTSQIEDQTAETARLLNEAIAEAVGEHRTRLSETNGQVAAALDSLSDEVARSILARSEALDETLERQQEAMEQVRERQQNALDDEMAHQRALMDKGLQQHQQVLGAKIEQHRTALSADVKAHQTALGEAAEAIRAAIATAAETTQRTIEGAAESGRRSIETDLLEPIGAIRAGLEGAAHAIALNPPASAAELAALLGEAAETMIRPEREALAQSAEKIAGLEQQARSLLAQIDRTARMNPVIQESLDRSSRGGDAPLTLSPDVRIDDQELPFGDLPRTALRTPLDWTAVIEVLDRAKPRPANQAAMKSAEADPDIQALVEATDAIQAELSDDGVFLEDLRPEHAPTSLWVRFAQGERGDELKPLAGTDDEIALAIVRGRLRRAPEFRANALRFVTAYIAMLQRAIKEIGDDQRLIEVAETKAGRAFQLLAEPMGILERASVTFDA